MHNENANQKKGVISHKLDLRPKKITRDKETYYIWYKD